MGIVKIFLYFIGFVFGGILLIFLQGLNSFAFYVGCFVVGSIIAFCVGRGYSRRNLKQAGKKIPEDVLEKIVREGKKSKKEVIEVKEKPKKTVREKVKKKKKK